MNSREYIAKRVLSITNNKAMLFYNMIECGSNEIAADSRCKTFFIIHKLRDGGIIIEYTKGKIFLSFFYNPKLVDRLNYDDIISELPLRFKEIVALVRKNGTQPIPESLIKEICILALKGVPKKRFAFLDYIDSRYSLLALALEDLIDNKDKHTYFYINKPLFGKINTHFRASTKIRIKDIQEIIDAEK